MKKSRIFNFTGSIESIHESCSIFNEDFYRNLHRFFPERYAFEKKVLRIWYLNATDEILYTTSEVEDPRFFHDFQVLF